MWTAIVYRPVKSGLFRVWESKGFHDKDNESGKDLAIRAANRSGEILPGYKVFVHKSRQE